MMMMNRAKYPASTRDRIKGAQGGPVSRLVIIRDLLLFQLKLFLDGLIDVTLLPLSIGAAVVEIFFGGERRGRLFYSILRFGERADLWLNLYGASRHADSDGLLGGSKAGSDTLLGEIEELVRGGDEPRRLRKRE
jgi:hypothetical protein